MKKQIITMLLLLIGTTSSWAQEKAYRISASGASDVTICQADTLMVTNEDGDVVKIDGEKINLFGASDYFVTVPTLERLDLFGASDAKSLTTLKGQNLVVNLAGSSDAILDVNYDSITVNLSGCSDLTLKGRCRSAKVSATEVSTINTDYLKTDTIVVDMTSLSEWSHGRQDVDLSDYFDDSEYYFDDLERHFDVDDHFNNWIQQHRKNAPKHKGHHKRHKQRSLLFDANWNGFEAGLNILTPGVEHWDTELPGTMELRQMRSWCFNINIADMGIAFNRKHSIGLFTGIGVGWNNYCFVNPVYFWKDPNGILSYSPIVDENGNGLNVDRSKIGIFYAQMPLMFEFRPFRQKVYIDLGVTGGMRLTSWQTIQFGENPMSYAVMHEAGDYANTMIADRSKYLEHRDLCVNFFKLDATMRIGSVDDNVGLFLKYALLPVFAKGKGPEVYPISLGFSINF